MSDEGRIISDVRLESWGPHRHGMGEIVSDWDDFRVEFDDAGHLMRLGRKGWREPICPECREPIRWVLDMASFTTYGGGHAMAHARCVWTQPAFDREREQAHPEH